MKLIMYILKKVLKAYVLGGRKLITDETAKKVIMW